MEKQRLTCLAAAQTDAGEVCTALAHRRRECEKGRSLTKDVGISSSEN
jgi:hypothetical protein